MLIFSVLSADGPNLLHYIGHENLCIFNHFSYENKICYELYIAGDWERISCPTPDAEYRFIFSVN